MLQRYTRSDLMARLLALGPLSRQEAIEITGWKPNIVGHALHQLRCGGEVRCICMGRRDTKYRLTDIARVPRLSDETIPRR